MADYIDRDKLLKKFCSHCYGEKTCTEDCFDAKIIKSIPTEDEKPAQWIPVTERLPEENGFYLCLYEAKHSGGVAMDEGLSILQYLDSKWHLNDAYSVTYWMPLPEPPKDGET